MPIAGRCVVYIGNNHRIKVTGRIGLEIPEAREARRGFVPLLVPLLSQAGDLIGTQGLHAHQTHVAI